MDQEEPDSVAAEDYFPLISMSHDELRAGNIPMPELQLEVYDYLKFLRRHKSFRAVMPGKKVVVRNRYIEDFAEGNHMVHLEVPERTPEDLYQRIGIIAKQDFFHKPDSAKNALRHTFKTHAHNLIAECGVDPEYDEDAFTMTFMLRGAMKNYDAAKTLKQNALQFEFDRETSIVKRKERKATIKSQSGLTPPTDKPEF